MSKTSQFFTKLNPLMMQVLPSSLHWPASTQLALVRFKGKKSGRFFTTPMAYHLFDDIVVIALAETKGRNWWRNYVEVAPMDILIKGEWRNGFASVLQAQDPEYKKWFEAVFDRAFFIPKIFGIDYDAGAGLSQSQITALAAKSGLVKFTERREDHCSPS
jgi:hypothetical protein